MMKMATPERERERGEREILGRWKEPKQSERNGRLCMVIGIFIWF
jgi:hypothetical protein